MSLFYKILNNQYRDSVSLMQVSKRLLADPAVKQASVVMATEANLEQLQHAGLALDIATKPTDLLIVIEGDATEENRLMDMAMTLLTPAKVDTQVTVETPTSLALAKREHTDINLALISVPGLYAASEALKALARGLNVMLFSDNVSVEQERTIKEYAHAHGLLVMGPDCGTAIINSTPLGFANVVNSGNIGIVAASGTGLQEVSCHISNLGAGISQAIGTGGRDLKEAVGGITMIDALARLQADPQTERIVIVSKPPAESVMERVMQQAVSHPKPIIVHFLGATEAQLTRLSAPHIQIASSLVEAAELAVSGQPLATPDLQHFDPLNTALQSLTAQQCHVRGVFAGGTFNYEAQLTLLASGFAVSSNAPVTGATLVTGGDASNPAGNVIWDMGDDEFTQGRPHPMIDPSLRNTFLMKEASRPDTAVVLFDVVLGYGAHPNPAEGLIPVIEQIQARPNAPVLIAHVCGTTGDPQQRDTQIAALKAHNVLVAPSNWHAAKWASFVLQHQSAR